MHNNFKLKAVFGALVVYISTLFAACSFNKLYLHPTKIKPEQVKAGLRSETVNVHYEGENFQPVFLGNQGDTLSLTYTIESVVFTSSSGNKLNGWLLKPKNQAPKITLLHFHGNAGFLMDHLDLMAPLVNRGFQVFMFDYSGFGLSEGKASRKNVLKDGMSALTYLKSRPEVQNTKLVIYGQSLGGHLSAVVAEKRQAEIDGLVIEGAFSSHRDIAANTAGILGRILVAEKYAAFKAIRKFKKPVLVIHSTEDRVIPFKFGQKIFENANQPKDFFEIKQCHICGPVYFGDEITKRINKMIGF